MPEPGTPALHAPPRTLRAYRDELLARYRKLPLTAPERGDLAVRIRILDEALHALGKRGA